MKTIVFLGSKAIGFFCLQHLLQQQQQLQAQIIAVGTNEKSALTQTAPSIQQLCNTHHIPLIQQLKQIPPCDFIISVQYHKILKANHINRAKKLAINLHMAPLPEYRGCNQFSFAIIDNASTFGTTLHRLEAGIDSGAIIAEKRFPIPPNCWVKELYTLTEKHSQLLFTQNIASILSGNYTLTPQHTLIAKRGTSYHYRHEIKQIKKIDLNWPANKIERHIRASYFPPFEPPYAYINQKKVYFTRHNQ